MYKKSRQFSFRHRGFECVACHKEEMVFGMGDDLAVCSVCGGALKKKWDNMVLTAQEVMQYVAPIVEAPVVAEPMPEPANEPVAEQPVEAPATEAPAAPAETAQSEAEHPMEAPVEAPAEAPTEPTPAA